MLDISSILQNLRFPHKLSTILTNPTRPFQRPSSHLPIHRIHQGSQYNTLLLSPTHLNDATLNIKCIESTFPSRAPSIVPTKSPSGAPTLSCINMLVERGGGEEKWVFEEDTVNLIGGRPTWKVGNDLIYYSG